MKGTFGHASSGMDEDGRGYTRAEPRVQPSSEGGDRTLGSGMGVLMTPCPVFFFAPRTLSGASRGLKGAKKLPPLQKPGSALGNATQRKG